MQDAVDKVWPTCGQRTVTIREYLVDAFNRVKQPRRRSEIKRNLIQAFFISMFLHKVVQVVRNHPVDRIELRHEVCPYTAHFLTLPRRHCSKKTSGVPLLQERRRGERDPGGSNRCNSQVECTCSYSTQDFLPGQRYWRGFAAGTVPGGSDVFQIRTV